jgi:hypothetical protein
VSGDLFVWIMQVTYGPVAEQGRRYTAASCSVVPASLHTSISCRTVSGVGASHVWRVTVGGQESAHSVDMTSYMAPVVTAVLGQGTFQANTKGGQNVSIAGSHFGSAADTVGKLVVTYGPPHNTSRFVAEKCVVEVDFRSIRCSTAQGSGRGHWWNVAVDGVWAPVFMANSSYASPVVSSYAGVGTVFGDPSCDGSVDCGATSGSQVVRISGDNFGAAALGNVLTVTYGVNGTDLEAADCFISVDHEEVTCLTVPGAGSDLKWTLVVDGLVSAAPTTAYGVPRITGVSGPGASSASTYGGEAVVVSGANFGPPEDQAKYFEYLSYGPNGRFLASNCTVVSHVQLLCRTAPGIGANLQWVVSVAGQQSLEAVTVSYAVPTVTSVQAPLGFSPTANRTNDNWLTSGMYQVRAWLQWVWREEVCLPVVVWAFVCGPAHWVQFVCVYRT